MDLAYNRAKDNEMNAPKILVIDDDPSLLPILESYLGSFFKIDFQDLIEEDHLKKKILCGEYDLTLLDLDLGSLSGLELLEEIRFESKTLPPNIILITSGGTIDDEIKTHELGVRDYIKKPFNKKLLKSIIEKHLTLLSQTSAESIVKGPFRLDKQKFELILKEAEKEEAVNLTLKEFKIFYLLFTNPNKIYSQLDIYNKVWEVESDSLLKTIDIHIGSIRKKLGPSSTYIKNKRGVGYYFEI
ncbi:MAG: DNA-binding response OmpR family regulator [Bacteriovoracaceae bacterium]|jgi:DNA-binding response OmpR family regulator